MERGVYGRDYTLFVDLPAMGSRLFRLLPEAPHPDAAKISAANAAKKPGQPKRGQPAPPKRPPRTKPDPSHLSPLAPCPALPLGPARASLLVSQERQPRLPAGMTGHCRSDFGILVLQIPTRKEVFCHAYHRLPAPGCAGPPCLRFSPCLWSCCASAHLAGLTGSFFFPLFSLWADCFLFCLTLAAVRRAGVRLNCFTARF